MTTFDLIFKYTLIFSLAALVVGFIVYIIKHQITTKIDCTTVKVTDDMDGHDFEYWCADLLKRSGFSDVVVTSASKDQGGDILATYNDLLYVFQCKRVSKKVGNHAVQEVVSARIYYEADVAVVITNNAFTPSAIELAESADVDLWDEATLENLLYKVVNHVV